MATETALNQTSRNWQQMAIAANGDIYAAVFIHDTSGAIYKRAGGVGDFTLVASIATGLTGIAIAPNGDIYCCGFSGDIYRQAGGVGDFVALSQTARSWQGMGATSNGDIYAFTVDYEGIYRRVGGAGNFLSLGQGAYAWRAMAVASNDVLYFFEDVDVYVGTGDLADLADLNQTTRTWSCASAAANGDIYTANYQGDIYRRVGGAGDFTALGLTSNRQWQGMVPNSNNDLYVATNGDIYLISGIIPPPPVRSFSSIIA